MKSYKSLESLTIKCEPHFKVKFADLLGMAHRTIFDMLARQIKRGSCSLGSEKL